MITGADLARLRKAFESRGLSRATADRAARELSLFRPALSGTSAFFLKTATNEAFQGFKAVAEHYAAAEDDTEGAEDAEDTEDAQEDATPPAASTRAKRKRGPVEPAAKPAAEPDAAALKSAVQNTVHDVVKGAVHDVVREVVNDIVRDAVKDAMRGVLRAA